MRKFEYPVIKISEFAEENIIIASGDTDPTSEGADEAARNWLLNNGVEAKNIIGFNL